MTKGLSEQLCFALSPATSGKELPGHTYPQFDVDACRHVAVQQR